MSTTATAVVVSKLESARSELQSMAIVMENGITSVSAAFQGLAGHTDSILNLAGAIVGCVENENISSILPRVQTLGLAARSFIEERVQATAGIIETVATEVQLLRKLLQLTGGQEAIALETRALSVLTNVEAARLDAVGVGFQFLARELGEFSNAFSEDSQKLASQMQSRRTAIEDIRSVLSAELPALREKLARVEADLDKDLASLNSRLTQLSSTPARFRVGVEHTAQQIAGVVAAVQAHDITRQQIEHVMEAFALISMSLNEGNADGGTHRELPRAYAGLTIQIYQLKAIRETIVGWTSQIKMCIAGILDVSASELVGIGPLVLQQEREVSSQLAHIELLERESQAYGARIQRTLAGLSILMRLVTEHSQKSRLVRDRLRLLSFNSIIEATRLGAQAGAILAIARSIKDISADWSEVTDQSGNVMQEIQNLVKQSSQVTAVFSEESNDRLREAQVQTANGLENLKVVAAFAGQQAQQMNEIAAKMQTKSGDLGAIGDLLDTCFGRVDAMLIEIEQITRQLEIDHPRVKQQYDHAEVEKLFSASYTTEMERQVLRAALRGAPLPAAQQEFVGNSVELF